MRDIKRIRPFLKELEVLWEESPDLRFGQLIYSLNHKICEDGDTFCIEDENYLKAIKDEKVRAIIKEIKEDIKGLKFHKLSKDNNNELICDYCEDPAIGSYIDENDDYNYIDMCEDHYKKSLEQRKDDKNV